MEQAGHDLACTTVYCNRYVPGNLDWDYGCRDRLLAYDSILLLDITKRTGDILDKALVVTSNQLQLATKFSTPNFSIDILIKVLRPSGPDSLPGGSWWQSGLGTHIGDTWTTFIQPELAGSTWPWMWWWWSNLEVKRTYSLPPHPVGGGCTMPPSSLAELVKRDFRYYSRILQCSAYRVSFLFGAPLKVLSVRLHSKSNQKSS